MGPTRYESTFPQIKKLKKSLHYELSGKCIALRDNIIMQKVEFYINGKELEIFNRSADSIFCPRGVELLSQMN